MSKFQVPSWNVVGCGDDTHTHTDIHKNVTDQTQRKYYFTSDILLVYQCFVLIGFVWKKNRWFPKTWPVSLLGWWSSGYYWPFDLGLWVQHFLPNVGPYCCFVLASFVPEWFSVAVPSSLEVDCAPHALLLVSLRHNTFPWYMTSVCPLQSLSRYHVCLFLLWQLHFFPSLGGSCSSAFITFALWDEMMPSQKYAENGSTLFIYILWVGFEANRSASNVLFSCQ